MWQAAETHEQEISKDGGYKWAAAGEDKTIERTIGFIDQKENGIDQKDQRKEGSTQKEVCRGTWSKAKDIKL